MSKPLFRMNITATQASLLNELISKVAVSADKAGAMAGIFDQVQAAKKYWGVVDPAPPAPPTA
jgi:hypothetical protein